MEAIFLKNRVQKIKNLILDPGQPNREGVTELDIIISDNKAQEINSLEYKTRQKIVFALLKEIHDFTPQNISNFVSYIKRSNFDSKEVLHRFSLYLNGKGKDLKVFQKTEIIKFLLSKDPSLVDPELINTGLAELQISNPWLFVSLINDISKDAAFKIIKYLIADDRFDKPAFLNLYLQWLKTPDTIFLRKVYKEILPLVNDDNFTKLMRSKLSSDEIRDIDNLNDKVTRVVKRIHLADNFNGSVNMRLRKKRRTHKHSGKLVQSSEYNAFRSRVLRNQYNEQHDD
jgi:hypothetical protein